MNLINGLGGASGFGENFIERSDDDLSAVIDLTAIFGASGLKFLGTAYASLVINNNGNVNFGIDGVTQFTPSGMQEVTGTPMIAAFFADVDTRGYSQAGNGPGAVTATSGGTSTGSNLVWYDIDTSGDGALTITWDDVGYFDVQTNKLNAFQLRLIGTGNGNFDIEFVYEAINWTTGDASGGVGGSGGLVARAGFTAGDGIDFRELGASGVQDSMLVLESTLGNTGQAGRFLFSSISGDAGDDLLYGATDDDLLSGGDGDDELVGFDGDDHLDGGAGADLMVGGLGDDTYIVRDAFDTIVEYAGEGIDTVQASISQSLAGLPEVENLMLVGIDAIDGTGNALNNLILGNGANNVIDGGSGTDTASYFNAIDAVTATLQTAIGSATGGGGTDTLVSIENLTGSIFGDALTGSAGRNVLDGLGGADTMTGLAGDDVYIVDHAGDLVVEAGAGGTDTVRSSVTHTLAVNVENLFLTGTASINGTGNPLANVLIGNDGANTLNGSGGVDRMVGGRGNDIYFVDSMLDVVVETSTLRTEIDTVSTGVSGYTLGANLENLRLFATGAADGTGNTLNNVLYAGPGSNVLNGGAGIDTASYLYAGAGVTVSLALASAQATGGSGSDTLIGFENLSGSNHADRLTGNGLANVIDGGPGNDTLDGGAGTDTVSYAGATAGVVVSLATVGAQATGGSGSDTLTNFENLSGSRYDDRLSGNASTNVIEGGAGNDTLDGGAGTDTVSYAATTAALTVSLALAGAQFTGGAGTDTLTGFENLIGGSSNDRLTGSASSNVIEGGAGNDTLDGGAGTDTASYVGASGAVTVSLATTLAQVTGGAGTDLLAGFESLIGSAFGDTLTGNANSNVLNGGAGADTMVGGDGDDTYYVDHPADLVSEASAAGGHDVVYARIDHTLGANLENLRVIVGGAVNATGNLLGNVLYSGDGNNVLDGGGDGIDTASYAFAIAAVTVDLGIVGTQTTGGSGSDTLLGIENLVGSAFADTLRGNGSANLLTGGGGADRFVLATLASDTITDFASGTDRIALAQSTLHVGNGDSVVDGAVQAGGPGGFTSLAELVIVTTDIAGSITAASAAAAIGSASGTYAVGQRALFAVDNGVQSALYLFTSSAVDAGVGSAELTLLATLQGAASTALADYLFVPG